MSRAGLLGRIVSRPYGVDYVPTTGSRRKTEASDLRNPKKTELGHGFRRRTTVPYSTGSMMCFVSGSGGSTRISEPSLGSVLALLSRRDAEISF
jgi:hypothetical protein